MTAPEDPREIQVDQRLAAAFEMGTLPRDLLLVGAAGTGKTYGILTCLHTIAADYPNLRMLFCRATRAALTESVLVTYEQEILPADGMESLSAGATRRIRQSYRYPNGSEIILGGLDNPAKILSTSWDVVFVNEAIEVSEEAWETLQSRLNRPGRPSWLGHLIGDTNPSDPSHWLKRRGEKGLTTHWDTSHKANPCLWSRGCWTDDGNRYIEGLKHLTGSRRKRLLDGVWAAGEGAWFDGFDATTHVSTAAEYAPGFPVHLSIDSGHHTGAVWMQYRPPGVCVFGDYLSVGRGAYGAALDVIERSKTYCSGRVDSACTDPAGRAATAIGPTVIEEYVRAGLRTHSWPIRTVVDSLALAESFVSIDPPEVMIHPRCKDLIDAFCNYRRGQRQGQFIDRPEDPQHPYEDLIDAFRGGLCDKYPEGRKGPSPLSLVHASRVF